MIGNLDRLLRPGDGFEVFLRAGGVILLLGEVGQRLGEAVGAELVDLGHLLGVVLDLLLEQRRQNGRRGAGLLQTPQLVDLGGQRTGRDHQRVLQFEAEIGRAQINAHVCTFFLSWGLSSHLHPR